MMQMNFDIVDSLFVVDTDYGPYATSLTGFEGLHHYEFMLNRSNGLWTMALDYGVERTFKSASISVNVLDGDPRAGTVTPQPDGTVVAVGDTIANKYFSDESVTSAGNAVGLGWAGWAGPPLSGNAFAGVGGVGDWKLYFAEATGNSVDNITMGNVPEPGTIIVWSLLGLTAAGFGLWRRKRAA
jgi:hypothetical protein